MRGNATRIDSLLMRAYLAQGHSFRCPPADRRSSAAIPRCAAAAWRISVLHCDVTSLYPSLMLQYRACTATDRLGVFLKLLADLRSFRVQAKNAVARAAGAERRNMEAMQQTFKILINSFYGYLGFWARPLQRFRRGQRRDAAGRESDPRSDRRS